MKLPETLREQMKIPLGILVPEEKTDKQTILEHLGSDYYLITVGDRTTEKMIDFGLIPSLQIVDGIEKREKRIHPKLTSETTELSVDNPPAEITTQSVEIIKKSFSMNSPVRLTVNGEEDLLVLPVCIHAPDNAIVMYGQPNEGLVIVKVTPEIRNKTQSLLDLME